MFLRAPSSDIESAKRAGDQASAALEGEIGPQPVERHDDAVPEADQKVDVRDHPDQPGHKAAQPNPAKIDDGGFAPDGGEIAIVAISERFNSLHAAQASFNEVADVTALLFGDRGDAA